MSNIEKENSSIVRRNDNHNGEMLLNERKYAQSRKKREKRNRVHCLT